MIVIVFRVVVGPNSRCRRLAILGLQRCGRHCQRDYKASAQ
jgi:hypothetical protein